MWYIKTKFVVFFYKNTYRYIHFPKIVCLRMKSFSEDLPSLGNPKSHHHESKPTKIQNSNLQCSMSSPYSKCLVHPNHVIVYPLNMWFHIAIEGPTN